MAKRKTKRAVKKTKQNKNKIGISPIADRVLIKEKIEDAKEKTASGIIIPATADKDSGAKRGTVIAVGEGKYEDGARAPLSVQEGDTVLFQWGEKIVHDGEEYYLVRDSEILAIIN